MGYDGVIYVDTDAVYQCMSMYNLEYQYKP